MACCLTGRIESHEFGYPSEVRALGVNLDPVLGAFVRFQGGVEVTEEGDTNR